MWGWSLFLFSTMFFMLYWKSTKKIGLLIFVAFLLRSGTALLHHYYIKLPAGCCDAVRFENIAWMWAEGGGNSLFFYFDPSNAYILSWIGSVVYTFFGRDPLLLQMINVLLGTVTVFVIYKTAKLLTTNKNALIIGWLFALHPTVIEHSAVFLREVHIILGLSLSIYFFIKWYQAHKPVYILLSVASISTSAIYHGGMIFGLLVMLIAIMGVLLRRLTQLTTSQFVKKGTLTTLLIVILGVSVVASVSLPRLSSVGELEQLMDVDQAAQAAGYAAEVRAHGRSGYLQGMSVNNPIDILWQAPIRSVYFLFLPFPWDVSSITHLKGFIDSGFLFYIFFLMWKYRRELWASDIYRYLLLILLLYILVYSFGTSNFGSAIRHKAKLLPLFVLFYGLKGRG